MNPFDDSDERSEASEQRENRPGLDEIDYRIDTHGGFFERMLERLHQQAVADPLGDSGDQTRPLASLRTREREDPTVGLLDAWATVADVLTFYQERIANEHYLRTATERRSVVELARLIGYEPDPGVAATAQLAFDVDDTESGPRKARVPAGTQVQSVPERGELPQTFETRSELVARPEWNQVGPRRERPQHLAIWVDPTDSDQTKLVIVDSDGSLGDGASTSTYALSDLYFVGPDLPRRRDSDASELTGKDVRAREVNSFYLDGVHEDLERGSPLLLVGTPLEALSSSGEQELLQRVKDVVVEREKQRTRIDVSGYDSSEDDGSGGASGVVNAYLWSEYVNPDFVNQAASNVHFARSIRSEKDVRVQTMSVELNYAFNVVPLQIEALATLPEPDPRRGVIAFERSVGFFGNNAPSHAAVKNAYEENKNPFGDNWDDEEYEIWQAYSSGTGRSYYSGGAAVVHLERTVDAIEADEWVFFEGEDTSGDTAREVYRVGNVAERSVTGFSLSTRTSRLSLRDAQASSEPEFGVRSTTAHVGNRQMTLADVPLSDVVGDPESSAERVGSDGLTLDGLYLGFSPGKRLLVGGESAESGAQVHEVATIARVEHVGDNTIVHFSDALLHAYRRATLRLRANVAEATHGESVVEVLGSGDASVANQSFELGSPPLTYVATASASGRKSTLTVRVNGVEWTQVDSLLELGAGDRGYVVDVDEDGDTRVTFGDGVHGLRLPSGRENVVAEYRSGTGLIGEVGAERLTLLKRRPAGIQTVTNPIRARGAADPESRDEVRDHAPSDTRLLERIVSMEDYEHFAEAYPGIGKARAELISHAGSTKIHLTVAGTTAEGAEVAPDKLRDLEHSIRQSSSGRYEVVARSLKLEDAVFEIDVSIQVEGARVTDDVVARVEQELAERFGYQAQRFHTRVSEAHVVTCVEHVVGVVAVLSVGLRRVSHPDTDTNLLIPAGTRVNTTSGEFEPAHLLFATPFTIEVSSK